MNDERTIRIMLLIILLVAIYLVFVRKAQERGRSGCLWFIIGMLSFVVPLVGSVAVGLAIAQSSRGHNLVEAFRTALIVGLSLAIIMTTAMAILLRRLPSKASPVRTRSYRLRKQKGDIASGAIEGKIEDDTEPDSSS